MANSSVAAAALGLPQSATKKRQRSMSPIRREEYCPYDDQDSQGQTDVVESRAQAKKRAKNEAKSPTGIQFVVCGCFVLIIFHGRF
jgi:hypothetical protein